MKRKNFISVIAIVIGYFSIVGINFAEEKTDEIQMVNKIISISAREGIKPSTLSSSPGTTVIWVNHSNQPAEILFLDKKVTLACGSPVNFFVGKDGAYESAKIPFGGTASLCFTEKGRFDYVYKTSSTFYPLQDKEHQGIIWIK
jgi:plastocyanin